MKRDRKSSAAPVLAIMAIVLVPLALYLGGYFLAGEYVAGPDKAARFYRYRWQSQFFTPAAKLESYLRGSPMIVFSQEEANEVMRLARPTLKAP